MTDKQIKDTIYPYLAGFGLALSLSHGFEWSEQSQRCLTTTEKELTGALKRLSVLTQPPTNKE